MKRLLICTGLLFAATTLLAQEPLTKKPPLSPAATADVAVDGKSITITYSSPRVKGREGKIFTSDGLIKETHKSYPVWRAGANAATTLITSNNLRLGDLHVPAGTYTLFVDISDPAHWVLIVSKDTGEWGLSYDPTKDLGRTPMTMSKPPVTVENLTYTLTDENDRGTLTLAWEDVSASVNFTIH